MSALILIRLPIHPLKPEITAIEPLAVFLFLINFPEIRKPIQILFSANTNIGDQTSNGAGRECTPRETKTHNLIAGFVVQDTEIIRFDDIPFQA